MLNHQAYHALPPSAAKLLPYFLGKVQLSLSDPAYYRTDFTFTYGEAIRYGCARRTFYQVVKALVATGFIDPVKRGGLRGTGMSSSVFLLSSRWRAYGTPAFEVKTWASFGSLQIEKMVAEGQ